MFLSNYTSLYKSISFSAGNIIFPNMLVIALISFISGNAKKPRCKCLALRNALQTTLSVPRHRCSSIKRRSHLFFSHSPSPRRCFGYFKFLLIFCKNFGSSEIILTCGIHLKECAPICSVIKLNGRQLLN